VVAEKWEKAHRNALTEEGELIPYGPVRRILRDDIPTYIEAPRAYRPEDIKLEPDKACAVVFGFPWEGGSIQLPQVYLPAGSTKAGPDSVYWRTGAHESPDWIRRYSMHHSLSHSGGRFLDRGRDFCLVDHLTVYDYGDVEIAPGDGLESARRCIEKVKEIVAAGAIPICLGGDHMCPYPMVKGISEASPGRIGIIDFDSHFDFGADNPDEPYNAGNQWYNILNECDTVQGKNLVQIGLRGDRNPSVWRWVSKEIGSTYFTTTDIWERGIRDVMREALEIARDGTERLYISFDIDAIDSTAAPGQKYPEPGGLSVRETIEAVRMASAGGVCGFDICCFGPQYDVRGATAQLLSRMALEVLAGIAGAGDP
jgi:agmatinase